MKKNHFAVPRGGKPSPGGDTPRDGPVAFPCTDSSPIILPTPPPSPLHHSESGRAAGLHRVNREAAGARRAAEGWRRAWNVLGELLLPRTCAGCGAAPGDRALLCAACARELCPLPEVRCPHCARAATAHLAQPAAETAQWTPRVTRCAECRTRPPPYRCVVAAMRSTGLVREVIHGFKYERKRHLLPLLRTWIVEASGAPLLKDPPIDTWVPVPLHWSRLWWRGFNQAALLARAVAKARGGLCVEALYRIRATGTQTRLEKEQRWHNLRGSIGVKKRMRPQILDREVALVDDVLTTGATAHACAHALLHAGARSVRVLTVARG